MRQRGATWAKRHQGWGVTGVGGSCRPFALIWAHLSAVWRAEGVDATCSGSDIPGPRDHRSQHTVPPVLGGKAAARDTGQWQNQACRVHSWGASQRSLQGRTEGREVLSAGLCGMFVNEPRGTGSAARWPWGVYRLQQIVILCLGGGAGRKLELYGSLNINNKPS